MIFTTKHKSAPEEKNWCVVLKSFGGTLDRGRLVQKLQKTFDISAEDALDVMQNTPIILLDHLPHGQASKVKDYFSDHGVEIALSNDNFYKRRCYRTVWPANPNLESILKVSVSSGVVAPRVSSPAYSEQEENRTAKTQTEQPLAESAAPSRQNSAWNTSQREFLEQKEMLVRDSLNLQEEVARLRATADRSLHQVTEKERALQVFIAEKKEREEEISRLESQVAAAEEKFKIAREEFRDTRGYFEERLVAQEAKMQDLQVQAEEMNRLLRESQASESTLEKALAQERAQVESTKSQIASGQLDWETRTVQLRHESELQKRLIQDYETKLAYLESVRKQAEESEIRIRQEMERQTLAFKNQEIQAHQMQTELGRFKSALENQEKTWNSRLQEVEVRERELESARRQIKELQTQMEHRELIQRKVFVAEQISAKELRLKSLVKKQENLENEARERETDLKKLLEEQEAVEKGLIEDRQAQKHLLEKLKAEMPLSESGEVLKMSQETPYPEWKAIS